MKKFTMSAAARKKISDSMKRRHAEKKQKEQAPPIPQKRVHIVLLGEENAAVVFTDGTVELAEAIRL